MEFIILPKWRDACLDCLALVHVFSGVQCNEIEWLSIEIVSHAEIVMYCQ
ncbi:hypothetical protein KEJ34_06860 [Candidatus Bathyarchaeota archaeon]|nr:hypothetical protein [Candidatus Bathyarchaeota archaeon]